MKIELSSDIEGFVQELVAAGRFADADEAVNYGLSLLRDQQAQKDAFMAMLKEAEAEAERDGYFTIEEVTAEIDEMLDALEAEKRSPTAAE